MSIFNAFLLGGLFCLVFQAALSYTRIGVPRLLVMGLALGGVFAALGIDAAIVAWGGAGMSVTVIGAGQGTFGSFSALLAGQPLPFVILLGIFTALTIFGLVAGLARQAIEKRLSKTEAAQARTPDTDLA